MDRHVRRGKSKLVQIAVLCVSLLWVSRPSCVFAETGCGWLKGATGYEIFPSAFSDSNGDGVGDLRGIRLKLDYLRSCTEEPEESLGVDLLWLTPIYPSPSYHGYDVTDYRTVNPELGTLDDFKELADACHSRGIRLILDLPVNHTSDQHPWFVQASSRRQSKYRKWYIWRRTFPGGWRRPWEPAGQSSDVWHRSGNAFYYGLFTASMPDLNLNYPPVRREIHEIARHWLMMGADGFRVDAARYLVETGGGSGQSDSSQTKTWLKKFVEFCTSVKPDALIVLEVWESMDVISPYLKTIGHAGVTTFNFDFAGAIINGVRNANPFWIKAVLDQREALYPSGACDILFLSNHDQNRIASELTSIAQQKLAASLLMTLPGTPFLYYGEEIGMTGVKPDPNLRRPFQWTDDPSPNGSLALNQQIRDPDSLWHHYCKLIRLRTDIPGLIHGSLDWIHLVPGDTWCAFRRSVQAGAEQNDMPGVSPLVILNFSRTPVTPELPRSAVCAETIRLNNVYNNTSLWLTDRDSIQTSPIGVTDDTPKPVVLPELLPGGIQIWVEEFRTVENNKEASQ